VRLLALDAAGRQVWSVPVPSVDAALRSGRVLVRGSTTLAAYDVASGRRVWQRPVPQQPQFFPYGYTLDSAPLLDADRLLLGTTTALRVLDVRSGAMRAYPLPTDGINTTYWPYQLAVSPRAVAVATNTGTVVLHRG
jgi:outer membrane protein assembly factor BamB